MTRRSISSVSFFRFAAASIAVSTGALSTSLLGCGAPNSLVGGECGSGFAECDYACVDLANDPDNCGACGNICSPAGATCVASTCIVREGDTPSGTPSAPVTANKDGGGGVTPEDGGVSSSGQGDAGNVPDGGSDGSRGGRGSTDDGGAPYDAASSSTDGTLPSGDAQIGSDAGDSQAATTADAGNNGLDAGSSDDASGSGLAISPGDDASAGEDSAAFASAADASTAADAPADAAIQCIPPFNTTQQCGDCFTVCSGVNDACISTGAGGFACSPLCTPPLTECNGQCFDERTDPNNCGTCGKICPSNLCGSSLCEGETPGDAIVIGHDYATTLPGTAQARALSNAVFLPSSNPIRILSFEQYADPGSVANVKAILSAAAAAQGKAIRLTVSVNGADIPSALDISTYDTLIVYDQAEAPAGVLGPLGTSWTEAVVSFLNAGGDVVALDGAAGTTAEMPVLESNAGILEVASHTRVAAGTALTVAAWGDSVALGVLSPYGAATSSAHFLPLLQSGATATYVVVDPVSTEPVIVHRTVSGQGNEDN